MRHVHEPNNSSEDPVKNYRTGVPRPLWGVYHQRMALALRRRGKLVLAALAVAVALAVAEGGLRLHGWITGTDYSLYDRELGAGHRLPPEIFTTESGLDVLRAGSQALVTTSDFRVRYQIDRQGMRGRFSGTDASGPWPRWLALGDSFTFGEGVEEEQTYVRLLGQRLSVRLLNLGVPGYGVDQALVLFERREPHLQYDGVILFFANSLYRRNNIDFENPEMVVPRGVERLPQDDPLLAPPPGALGRSHLLSLLHYQVRVLRLSKLLEQEDLATWGQPGGRGERDTRRIVLGNPRRDQRATRILQRMARVAGKRGKPLVVVNIEPGGRFPLFETLKQELVYIDLGEDLRLEAQRRSLRFKYDRHFNPETHRRIAELLGPRLRRMVTPSGR